MAETLAHEAYRRRVEYVRELLDEIGDELANDEADAAAEPQDWSYAGTMGRVGELLEQVLQALSVRPVDGPSGVPPLPR